MSLRICEPHRRRVMAAIHDVGLTARVSLSDDHLAQRVARNDQYDIDPLHRVSQALVQLAATICQHNGVNWRHIGCPCCYFADESRERDWIGNSVRAVSELIERKDREAQAERERNAELEAAARS